MNAPVISLAKVREERKPHWSGPCVCLGCRHEWDAVGPMPYVGDLDCPACGTAKGAVKLLFGAGEGDLVCTCDCGSEALTAYIRDGLKYVRCMVCGDDLTLSFFDT